MADPSAEQIRAAIQTHGSVDAAAKPLGLTRKRMRELAKGATSGPEPTGFTIAGDDATIVAEPSQVIGDVEALIRRYKLDPADWIIERVTVNRWNAMTSDKATGDNRIVDMHQLKVQLKRRVTITLLSPARHVPKLRKGPKLPQRDCEYDVIEADHQVPYHDPRLHEASVQLVQRLQPNRQVFAGDGMDLPTISRWPDHPAATATPQECVDTWHDLLRDKRDASPQTEALILKGNHDWRIEGEQLTRAERMYGLAPAHETVAALDLRRLLHLERLRIEMVIDPRGWEHAEIELVEGPHGLVVRHGWLTGKNTAERSLAARGRSLIVFHTHARESVYMWDPSMEIERQAAVGGCMCLVRNQRFPHFAVCDKWLQGLVVVTRWAGGFQIEHARWDGRTLSWRNERFTP